MKKIKRYISLTTGFMLSLLILFNFSSCGNYVSQEHLRANLEKVLEERYQESFTCLNVWGSGGVSYVGICYPNENPDVVFEANFF